MADIKNISLKIVGLIWFCVGIGLAIAGALWLALLGIGPKLVIFLATSIVIGLGKGKFILSKVAARYYKRADTLIFNNNDILTGWLKILGTRGFIFIGSMMLLGSLLRHNNNIDRPILGVIYLAVGIALLYASKVFFTKVALK